MTEPSISDHEIVHALSVIEVPDDTLRRIDLKGIIGVVDEAAANVQKRSADLDSARKELKDGWWIGNWWNNREEKVGDLQYVLQKSITDLSSRTTQLLVFNTAISRELSKQQQSLITQQELLKDQTLKIAKQNEDIFDQQMLLEQQQKEINAANQGLLEAKGVTADQAKRLIGCVNRVEAAEGQIAESHTRVLEEVRSQVQANSAEFEMRLAQNSEKLAGQISLQIHQVKNKVAEIQQQANRQIDALGVKLQDDTNSMKRELEAVTGALMASIQENHTSLTSAVDALAQTQNAERLRFEATIGTNISNTKDDLARRLKGHLIALIFLSCIIFGSVVAQIAPHVHH